MDTLLTGAQTAAATGGGLALFLGAVIAVGVWRR